MIKSFAHKGLEELYTKGKTTRIQPHLISKCLIILTALKRAEQPQHMNLPGFYFHGLQGNPQRWSVRVNKNWRITFAWDEGAIAVNFEDYH